MSSTTSRPRPTPPPDLTRTVRGLPYVRPWTQPATLGPCSIAPALAVSDVALLVAEDEGDLSELTVSYRGAHAEADGEEVGRFALSAYAIEQLADALTVTVTHRLTGRLESLARGPQAAQLADALSYLLDLAGSPELKHRDLDRVVDDLHAILGEPAGS